MSVARDIKYLLPSEADEAWGIVVNSVGKQEISPGYLSYPPERIHPLSFTFSTERGRTLDSYQLLYIINGRGVFYYSRDEYQEVKAGDIIILRPDIWHNYFPDKSTGWKELWIGFKGVVADMWLSSIDLFSNGQTICNIGIQEDVVSVYEDAIVIAKSEHASHQKSLVGLISIILGKIQAQSRSASLANNETQEKMEKAKVIMRNRYLEDFLIQEIAENLNVSYSWFRKLFKEYTGISPAQYIQKLRMHQARYLLSTTSLSIKSVSYAVNYSDVSHFITLFKKVVGCTPGEYQQKYKK